MDYIWKRTNNFRLGTHNINLSFMGQLLISIMGTSPFFTLQVWSMNWAKQDFWSKKLGVQGFYVIHNSPVEIVILVQLFLCKPAVIWYTLLTLDLLCSNQRTDVHMDKRQITETYSGNYRIIKVPDQDHLICLGQKKGKTHLLSLLP